MAEIRIVSDPCRKRISFFRYLPENEKWEEITSEVAPDSRLLSESISGGVFFFKAAEIIEIIYDEYFTEDDKLKIVFEGIDFEYQVLTEICSICKMSGNIDLKRSSRVLPNAWDALNIVSKTYDSVRPLSLRLLEMTDSSDNPDIHSRSQSMYSSLQRFIDISNGSVPVCIFGNHRTDRSIFLNELVGFKFLPSGDDNATSYISRISQSKDANSASIHFMCSGVPTDLFITSSSCRLQPPLDQNLLPEDLSCALQTIFQDCNRELVPQTVKRILQAISIYGTACISDIVSIEVPFNCASFLYKSQENIVLYDMPDFNSPAFPESVQNLRKALTDCSGGLAIYIAQYSDLDCSESTKQLEEISSIETLDKRFNLLIISEPDILDIRLDKLEQLRRQPTAVQNKFNPAAIFFVSPVLGFGSKMGGIFTNVNFAEEHCIQAFDNPIQFITNFVSIYYPCIKCYLSLTHLSNIISNATSIISDYVTEKNKEMEALSSWLLPEYWQPKDQQPFINLQTKYFHIRDVSLREYKDNIQNFESILLCCIEKSANFDFAYAPNKSTIEGFMININPYRRIMSIYSKIVRLNANQLFDELYSIFKDQIFNYSYNCLKINFDELKKEAELFILESITFSNELQHEVNSVISNFECTTRFHDWEVSPLNSDKQTNKSNGKEYLTSKINEFFAGVEEAYASNLNRLCKELLASIKNCIPPLFSPYIRLYDDEIYSLNKLQSAIDYLSLNLNPLIY